jgi:PAS domain S-box-containing protein
MESLRVAWKRIAHLRAPWTAEWGSGATREKPGDKKGVQKQLRPSLVKVRLRPQSMCLLRDLVVVFVVFATAIVLSSVLDLHGTFAAASIQLKDSYFQYDEIIVALAVLAPALSVFAIRRWRELEVEIDERLVVESALKESEERYRTLAEAAQDFIFIVGRDDRIYYINTHAAGKLGRPVKKIVGKERHKVFPKSMAKQQDIKLERVFNEGVPLHLDNIAVFSGMEAWQSTSLVTIYGEDDEVKAVLAIARDNTERKLAETELQRAKDSLEVAVAKRTRELQELNERLQLGLNEKN